MAVHSDFHSFPSRCVFMALLVAICGAREICDKSKCPGPLAYYRELKCTPIYKNPDDCCAAAFDCSHLEKLSKDKCYVNGHEYSIGEKLRDEDANPCDINCECRQDDETQVAMFICAALDCGFDSLEKNCFYRWSYNTCCPSEHVCLKEGEKRETCEVDGNIYEDGMPFSPKANPDLDCNCLPGYIGENIEPFCKKPNRRFCDPLFTQPNDIRNKCAPIFSGFYTPQDDCGHSSRCATEEDSVVHNHDKESVTETDEHSVCRFGNLTMHIGDTLKKVENSYISACSVCKCEVPPIPTCTKDTKCNYRDSGL